MQLVGPASAFRIRIDCAICKRSVERIEVEQNVCSMRVEFTVWCHGARETKAVDEQFLALDGAQGIASGETVGVAFTDASLTGPAEPGQALSTGNLASHPSDSFGNPL